MGGNETGQNEAAAAAVLRAERQKKEREAAIEAQRIAIEEATRNRLEELEERESEDQGRLLQELDERQIDQEMNEAAESESVNEKAPEKETGALQKEFKCPQCEEKFRSIPLLKSHIISVHKKQTESTSLKKAVHTAGCLLYTSDAADE